MRRNRSKSVKSRFVAAIIASAGLALGAPAAGIAQNVDPTDEQYEQGILNEGGSGTFTESDSGTGSGTGTDSPISGDVATGEIGELPFTGLDVAAIAAIGIGLAGGGFVVRRASRAGDVS